LGIYGTASAIALAKGGKLHEMSDNKRLKAKALKIIKRMNKNLRKFNQYKQVVHKTKDLQEDGASSSGSEGYKLWKKHKYSKYVRINLKNENQGDPDSLSAGSSE